MLAERLTSMEGLRMQSRSKLLCAAVFALALMGCNSTEPDSNNYNTEGVLDETGGRITSAVALLAPTGTNTAMGTVTFTEEAGGVRVVALLTMVPAGDHGFHVHVRGDCRGNGDSALGHFN